MILAGHVARIGKGEVFTGCWWGNMMGRDNLEDPGIDGRIILNRSSGNGMWGMDCIELAQDRKRWPALVVAVMNFQVP
jgi:hypothetical protein